MILIAVQEVSRDIDHLYNHLYNNPKVERYLTFYGLNLQYMKSRVRVRVRLLNDSGTGC